MKREEVARARAVCAGCPVQRACLRDSLDLREEHGVRAGYTAQDRRRAFELLGTPVDADDPESEITPAEVDVVMAAYDEGVLAPLVQRQ